ncbi:hypothetical protein F5Y15DRAFT_395703 [Xylariaceae sp. FL0016]|nr:hypothetical protein F5Y15DRAFT_395703 [Xylariaceae sp. FL0016]
MSDGESDEAKRMSKKRKASRACDRCNSQHQPCDNAVPKCSVCVRAGTDCTYNRPVRKRGPRSGYTGQNGERLWAIVLQARPEIEDIVLQILRGGTYSSTGISNLDYYRNNDNQTELVNKFNESRLGRYLQNGESVDLNLPPLDQELPLLTTLSHKRAETNFGQVLNSNHGTSHRQHRSLSSVPSVHAGIVNPHGAPQNPGEIYLQSEDIRRNAFNHPQTQGYGFETSVSRETPLEFDTDRSPSAMAVTQSAALGPNGEGYRDQGRQTTINSEGRNGVEQSSLMAQQSCQPTNTTPTGPGPSGFDFTNTSQWLDSIPTDTLLNLGFMPGEGMAEDFLELCENPDPIDYTPSASVDQNEDEEAVWRRLVMRGRFI